MAKFHITTKNGRQRALWLRLFGTDVLSVTAAYPHERFYPDGRSSWYGFDTRAIGEHACRRLAAYIAARHWGKTFEAALADVRYGWRIDAADCQLLSQPETTQDPCVAVPEITVSPIRPNKWTWPRPQLVYGRPSIGHEPSSKIYGNH